MDGLTVDPDSGLPLGPAVASHSALRPSRQVIAGRHIRLEPLNADSHGGSLWRETHGPGTAARWQYLFEAPFPDERAFHVHLAEAARSDERIYFAIVESASGDALGYAALMRIEPENRCIEVGCIVYGPRLQRHAGGTEAQFLLMRHVFEALGYRRYEWKCNALNAASRTAAVRLGFTFEGIFRQHMIIRGRSRDTAWYAIIDREWPAIRTALVRWLAPDNFDAAGIQKQTLAAIRSTL